MKKCEMITLERAVFIPLETLVHDYNDAIERYGICNKNCRNK